MLLSCPLCCKPHFEGVDSLRATLVSVATSPLTCPVCKETLLGLDKLTIHLFGHVNDNIGVSADNKENADTGEGHGDFKIVGEGYFNGTGKTCTKPISTEPDISRINQDLEAAPPHKSPNLEKEQETIACDICNFTFSDRNILDMHQKLLHQTIPDKKTGQYSYHCHLCSKKFRMRGSLMVHLRVAHYGFSNHINLPSSLLANNDTESQSNKQLNSSTEIELADKGPAKSQDCKQWSCDVCAKLFTTKYFLKKHKRLHTGEMPYSCNICNKSFTFQQSYHKHMLYHSSEKPYVCNECGRAFKEHSTLQNHIRIHSGERPFGCEICGKNFRQRVSYLVHMRIHTGVMPYKCTACNKNFRYKVSQKSHKCPMNPPGAVIRIADVETVGALSTDRISKDNLDNICNKSLNSSPSTDTNNTQINKAVKCIMSVDYDTGSINLIPQPITEVNSVSQNPLVYPETNTLVRTTNFNHGEGHQRIIAEDNYVYNDSSEIQGDIYSMVSPILPQVESLCLHNSPVSQPASPIEVIREKCLEELFK